MVRAGVQPDPEARRLTRLSRRTLIAGAAAAALPSPSLAQGSRSWDVAVVGAGVFGAWTAEKLRQAGKSVLLLDAWGPAHARASSGGESRMTRTSYGGSEVYSRMAWESLPEWKALSSAAGLPLFHRTGVLFLFQRAEPYALESIDTHKRLGLALEQLDRRALAQRFPQIETGDISLGLLEPGMGALMARRAVQTLVDQFVRGGGEYRRARVLPPSGALFESLRTSDGATIRAGQFVFACGPWLPRLFPELLGGRIFPTRQEIFFFAAPAGDDRFGPGKLPGWADFNDGNIVYGFPDLEARGFKIADDRHGPPIDPERGDRAASAEGLATVRAYMARRFPGLGGAPMVESRVCQYENSANGDLLIDRHPAHENVLLVGAGSGHGFKHGPAVGRYAAELLLGRLAVAEPRFSLASKGLVQQRAVH